MFKKINEDAKLPTRATKYSACVDVYANEDVVIGAGETKMIGLGIAIDNDLIARIAIGFDEDDLIEDYYDENEIRSYKIEIENFKKSHYLQLSLRSSLGKKGLILPNGVGIIDLDYKDEIKMIIHNPINIVTTTKIEDDFMFLTYGADYTKDPFNNGCRFRKAHIKKGDRIGQITLLEHKSYLFGIDSEEERSGGFGSTGIK